MRRRKEELITAYTNGNYIVRFFSSGVQKYYLINEDEEPVSKFPDVVYWKITNRCEMNCGHCKDSSTIDGDVSRISAFSWMKTLHRNTKVIITGGNPFTYPRLKDALVALHKTSLFVAVELNILQIPTYIEMIEELVKENLVQEIILSLGYTPTYGMGVAEMRTMYKEIFAKSKLPFTYSYVLGMHSHNQILFLQDPELDFRFFGYSMQGRGSDFYTNFNKIVKAKVGGKKRGNLNILERILEAKNQMPAYISKYENVRFDALAIDQLHPQELFTKEEWFENHINDDDRFSLFIDTVTKTFSNSPTATVTYKMTEDIQQMYQILQKARKENATDDH